MQQRILVRAEVFREGDLYVGICPDLDVSSYGETVDQARASLQEALGAFLEECESMGTLVQTLQEAGFVQRGTDWLPREPITAELIPVASPSL
jgi:predicted RNase H-like HicB family nuclease